MKHKFKNICVDATTLLKDVNKLSTFMNKLNKQAALQEGNGMGWTANDYKGDGFEAFCEVLINCSPIDKRINIIKYEPLKNVADMGVDGEGMTIDKKPCYVQAKYISNVTHTLTANNSTLSNFISHAATKPEYKGQGTCDFVIMTTGKEVHRTVMEDMWNGQARSLVYKDLKKLVDKNEAFWDIFRDEMGA
jgi:hypothetical protein